MVLEVRSPLTSSCALDKLFGPTWQPHAGEAAGPFKPDRRASAPVVSSPGSSTAARRCDPTQDDICRGPPRPASISPGIVSWPLILTSEASSPRGDGNNGGSSSNGSIRNPQTVSSSMMTMPSSASRPARPRTNSSPASFPFTQIVPSASPSLRFPSLTLPVRPRSASKRARPAADVDGPHTSSESCKKRRLRLRLITSRLSRPFSQPATHIVVRDSPGAAKGGDRRIMRHGAAAELARRLLGVQGSMLRRLAVLNRVRLRVYDEARQRGDSGIAGAAANAALLHCSQTLTAARFMATQQSGTLADRTRMSPLQKVTRYGVTANIQHPSKVRMSPSPPGTPPARAVDAAGTLGLPPTPRLRPLSSPDLVPLQSEVEVVDDEECAFPTADLEGRYESSDEPDDVYSDFGLIFGGAGESDEEDGHSYEEYLDELDGIPWIAR